MMVQTKLLAGGLPTNFHATTFVQTLHVFFTVDFFQTKKGSYTFYSYPLLIIKLLYSFILIQQALIYSRNFIPFKVEFHGTV
jgi:hypothetical protein